MKKTISFEGCPYEDQDYFAIIENANAMCSAILDAREKIRSRLKWDEDVSEPEAKFLEEIQDILYMEGLI